MFPNSLDCVLLAFYQKLDSRGVKLLFKEIINQGTLTNPNDSLSNIFMLFESRFVFVMKFDQFVINDVFVMLIEENTVTFQ